MPSKGTPLLAEVLSQESRMSMPIVTPPPSVDRVTTAQTVQR